MQQFNLDTWLKDKSRKVVTRDRRPVRIVCWDAKMECPIIALALNKSNNKEISLHYHVDGTYSPLMESDVDLFFADEEEELTEFEKAIYQYICTIVTACDGNVYGDKELKPIVKGIAKELLDLARKELEKSIEDGAIEFAKSYMENVNPSFEKVQESEELWKWKTSCLRGINKAYSQGKKDALKELPKWKKATEYKDFEINEACILDDDIYPIIATNVNIGEYYLELDELKNLPLEK